MVDSSYINPIANTGNIGFDTSNYALMSLISQSTQAYSAMHNPFWMEGHFRPMSESYALYEEAVRRGNGNILGSVELTIHETEDANILNVPADGVSFRPDMGVKSVTYSQHVPIGDFARRKGFQINDELDQFRGLMNPIIANKIFKNMSDLANDLAPKSTYYVARKFESSMHYVQRLRDETNKVIIPFLCQYDLPGVLSDYTTKPSYRTHNFIVNNSKRLIAGESLDYNYKAVSTVADEGFVNMCSQFLGNFTDGRNTEIVGNTGLYERTTYSGKFGVTQSPYRLQDRSRYFKRGSNPGTSSDGYVIPRYSADGKTLLSGLGGDKNWRLFWLEPVSQSPDAPTCNPGNDWYAYIAMDGIIAEKSMIAVGDIFEFGDLNKYGYRPSTAPTSTPLQLIASDLSVDKYIEEVTDTHFIKAKDWGRSLGICFRIRITTPLRMPTIYQHPSGDVTKRVIADGEGKGNLWLSLDFGSVTIPDVTMEGQYLVIKGSADGGPWVYGNANSDIFEQTVNSPRKVKAIQILLFGTDEIPQTKSIPMYPMANNRSMIYTFRGDSVNHIPFLYDHLNPETSFNEVMMGRGRIGYERELINFKDYQPLSYRLGFAPSMDWKYHMIKVISGVSTLAYRNNTNFIGTAINPEGLGMYQEGFLGNSPVVAEPAPEPAPAFDAGGLRNKKIA